MATTVGRGWCVTTLRRLDPKTNCNLFQVAWYDTSDTNYGPYDLPALQFDDPALARTVCAALDNAFRKRATNPSDVKAVLRVAQAAIDMR